MAFSKLEKTEWQGYLDRISKVLEGKRAEVEVDALSLGSQIEAEWLPLLGISYDQKRDTLDVILEGLDHRIGKPRELYVEQLATELRSLEVVDGDDVRHIIKLRGPLMLPAP